MSNFIRRYVLFPMSFVAFAVTCTFVYYILSSGWLLDYDNRKLAAVCAEDASEGCPLLWQDYLETKRENKTLKLIVKECSVLIPEAIPPADTGR